MTDVAFNLAMLVVDALALAWLRRFRPAVPLGRVALAVMLVGGLALPVAVPMAKDPFHVLRFGAWALFVHGPLVLLAAAALAWKGARRVALAAVGVAVAVVAVAIDAFFIEPHWLEVQRVSLTSARVTRPLRVLVLADIQTDHVGDYERDALRRGMAERPDVVLFAGDYVHEWDEYQHARLRAQLNRLLRALDVRGTLGAAAVRGNVDPDAWPAVFQGLPVEAREGTHAFTRGEVTVTALSFRDSFDTRLRVPRADGFHIVVGHGPDFALGDVDADLLVAGHTHGGQVRLPFVGPLVTLSRVPRRWAAGVTSLSRGRTLVVSRGIGMERGMAPRLRFLCRPQVVIVEVRPASR